MNKKELLKTLRKSPNWSKYLFEAFGEFPAIMFTLGADVICDMLKDSIRHRDAELMASYLPEIYEKKYDFRFMNALKRRIDFVCEVFANNPDCINAIPSLPIDEIILKMIVDEGWWQIKEYYAAEADTDLSCSDLAIGTDSTAFETGIGEDERMAYDSEDTYSEWLWEMLGDCDVESVFDGNPIKGDTAKELGAFDYSYANWFKG